MDGDDEKEQQPSEAPSIDAQESTHIIHGNEIKQVYK